MSSPQTNNPETPTTNLTKRSTHAHTPTQKSYLQPHKQQIWAANHYLHPAAHLPLEAIELMAAWLFARPLPFQVDILYICVYMYITGRDRG